MEFKAGDRVHVTRLDGENVNFYGTLKKCEYDKNSLHLTKCTHKRYEHKRIVKNHMTGYGEGKTVYYTLATDEEDSEEPVIERNELIKDLEKSKEENNNLKQLVSDYKEFAEDHLVSYLEYRAIEDENETLKSENKALRLQSDEYFKLWQEQERKYNKLTEHIRLKALHNPSISRYKDLMYFINEMEGK